MRQRTCAVFEATSFNTGETDSEARRAGADVVCWLIEELRRRRIETDEPGAEQEDHGWYATLMFDGARHDLVVSHVPGTEVPRWLVCVERSVGLFGTLLGRRSRSVARGLPELIDEILSTSAKVHKVGWMAFQEVRGGLLHESEWAERP
jgi:hypothetical protein